MEAVKIYEDIATRTGGDIYVGVVGPVRTGKSTFIKRFMESLVLPNIENVYVKERARDELPQSGSGRTIMTAEPKFVPEEAAEIIMGPASMKMRLIDCVGYMIPGAIGHTEDESPRMVTTPWFDHEIPMTEAAEIGTRKVIGEHSTIGLVITTDGTITEIPREDYTEAEDRVINELKMHNKPFIVLINSLEPYSDHALKVAEDIANKHKVTCMPVNCMELDEERITMIMRTLLYEFPMVEYGIDLPEWVDSLPADHWLKDALYSAAREAAAKMRRVGEAESIVGALRDCEFVERGTLDTIDLGIGVARASVVVHRELFYRILTEQSGFPINGDGDLLPLLAGLARAKSEYDKVSDALGQVRATGYGIVMPSVDELKLEEPEIVKQGGRFGVKLKASAPSIHMIRADIETEVSPIVGSERQSEDLVHYMLSEFDGDPSRIWQSNIFGKSLHELVSEGLHNKLYRMPDDARMKLQETLQRIINEGSGGLICIIL